MGRKLTLGGLERRHNVKDLVVPERTGRCQSERPMSGERHGERTYSLSQLSDGHASEARHPRSARAHLQTSDGHHGRDMYVRHG